MREYVNHESEARVVYLVIVNCISLLWASNMFLFPIMIIIMPCHGYNIGKNIVGWFALKLKSW